MAVVLGHLALEGRKRMAKLGKVVGTELGSISNEKMKGRRESRESIREKVIGENLS